MTAPIPTTPVPETAPARSGPPLSPIQQAAQNARERLADGTLELPGSLAAPKTTVSVPGVTLEPTPPVSPEPLVEASPVEEEVPLEEEAPPEGEAPLPESFVVTVPNNRPELPDLELEVPDQHTADVIGMLKNGFLRGEDYRAQMGQVENLKDDLEDFRGQIEADPIGFMQQHIPAEAKMLVAMDLITNPQLFPQILEVVKTFVQNPEKLETMRARMDSERYKLKETLTEQAQVRRESRQNATEIMGAINKMVPGTVPGPQAQKFIEEARQEVARYAERHGLRTLPITDLPIVLAQRLLAYGIDPVQAATRMAGKAATETSSPQTGQPSVGVKLKMASDRRKAAAVAAPAGSTTPATTALQMPKGLKISEAAEWAKKNLIR